MIKLFSLKQEKEAEASNSASGQSKIAPGLLRMQKDVSELKFDKKKDGIEIDFYNGPEDLMNFTINIEPMSGIYKDGKFTFDVKVPKTYPHDAPKVVCKTTVYHPNIDMEGHVCLNILREDWKPVLNMQSVVFGLQFLMLEPNADDPLNKEAANMLIDSKDKFQQRVRMTFKGRSMMVEGKSYEFPAFS